MSFENKLFEGIYYSRFIASWVKSSGTAIRPREMECWLKQLTINGKKIPKDVIDEIVFLGINGKLELEENASLYLMDKERNWEKEIKKLNKELEEAIKRRKELETKMEAWKKLFTEGLKED